MRVSRSPRRDLVFKFLIKGYSEKEIAEEMGITVKAVKDHKTYIFKYNKVDTTPKLMANYANKQIMDRDNKIKELENKILALRAEMAPTTSKKIEELPFLSRGIN